MHTSTHPGKVKYDLEVVDGNKSISQPPERCAHDGDAGYDLLVTESENGLS